MEEALIAFLNANISIPVFYIKEADDSVFPRIVMFSVSERRHYDTEVRKMRIQISLWHTDRFQGLALREEVYDALQRFNGILNGYRVHEIAHDAQNIIYEPEIRAFHFVTDYQVTYIGDQ